MPVIINEIQITAFVSEQKNQQAASPVNTEKDKELIIKTCIEEVLRIMQEKQER